MVVVYPPIQSAWAFTLAFELAVPALRGAGYVYRHFIGCHEADVIILVGPNHGRPCQLLSVLSAFRIYSAGFLESIPQDVFARRL